MCARIKFNICKTNRFNVRDLSASSKIIPNLTYFVFSTELTQRKIILDSPKVNAVCVGHKFSLKDGKYNMFSSLENTNITQIKYVYSPICVRLHETNTNKTF